MTTRWKINTVDIYTAYGAAIKQGSYLDIMSPPVPRKRLEHDYIDANGSDVDTVSALTYEPRRYALKILITGANYAGYWANYNALLAVLAVPGTFALYIKDIGITVNLLYEGMKCVSKPRSLRSGRIAVEYEVSVFEPNPVNRTYDPA